MPGGATPPIGRDFLKIRSGVWRLEPPQIKQAPGGHPFGAPLRYPGSLLGPRGLARSKAGKRGGGLFGHFFPPLWPSQGMWPLWPSQGPQAPHWGEEGWDTPPSRTPLWTQRSLTKTPRGRDRGFRSVCPAAVSIHFLFSFWQNGHHQKHSQ